MDGQLVLYSDSKGAAKIVAMFRERTLPAYVAFGTGNWGKRKVIGEALLLTAKHENIDTPHIARPWGILKQAQYGSGQAGFVFPSCFGTYGNRDLVAEYLDNDLLARPIAVCPASSSNISWPCSAGSSLVLGCARAADPTPAGAFSSPACGPKLHSLAMLKQQSKATTRTPRRQPDSHASRSPFLIRCEYSNDALRQDDTATTTVTKHFRVFVAEPINHLHIAVHNPATPYAHSADIFIHGRAGKLTMDFCARAHHLDTAEGAVCQTCQSDDACFDALVGVRIPVYRWLQLIVTPHLAMNTSCVATANHCKEGYFSAGSALAGRNVDRLLTDG